MKGRISCYFSGDLSRKLLPWIINPSCTAIYIWRRLFFVFIYENIVITRGYFTLAVFACR